MTEGPLDRRHNDDRMRRLSDDVGLLRGDVQSLTEALLVLNDLRQRQEDTQHTVTEQGQLLVVQSAHVDDTIRNVRRALRRTRRRVAAIAVAVVVVAAAVSWLGYQTAQSHSAQRAQEQRGACEHRNTQASALNAYLHANVAFDHGMIATEKRNGYVSAAIRDARVKSYETVLAGDTIALKAFSTNPLDCARIYPHTHP